MRNITLEKLKWLKKENIKREIWTYCNGSTKIYVNAKIGTTQQNSKCRLRGDRDKIANHIIKEFLN